MSTTKKPKIIWIVEYNQWKGYYPFERATILGEQLVQVSEFFLFLKDAPQSVLQKCIELQITPILFENYKELLAAIRPLQASCIILDSFDVPLDKVERLHNFCDTFIMLDDFSESTKLATFNFKLLYEETREFTYSNEILGSYFFVASHQLQQVRAKRLSEPLFNNETPHICIYFEDGDAQNLTYRTLRHFIQLHIPIKISVLIDEHYKHAVDDLRLMALSRKNIELHFDEASIYQSLSVADFLVCNTLYTPYKAAYINIPCITTAQYERELPFVFPTEENGFSHIGLGRKMKQSQLQNALMELLLHDSRKQRALKLQQKHNLQHNNELFLKLIVDLANKQAHFPSII